MKKIVAKIRQEAQKYTTSSEGSHDWEHTERVLNLAVRIGKEEGANLEVLELAVLLHDIGRSEQSRTRGKICHAEHGAKLAREILKKYQLEKETVDNIIRCIVSHRFRKGVPPASIEAKVLFDADKLDSIGAVGIGRAFYYAGHIGSKIHDPQVNRAVSAEYTSDDTAYREYAVRLCQVKERLFTRSGQKIAKERDDFMTEFFDRLNKEFGGSL